MFEFKFKDKDCEFNNIEDILSTENVISYLEGNEMSWAYVNMLNDCPKCTKNKDIEQKIYCRDDFYIACNEETKEIIYSNDSDYILDNYDEKEGWDIYIIEIGHCSKCDSWYIDCNNF